MSYTITNLKSDLQQTLTSAGNNFSKITGPDTLIQRAARDVLSDVALYELIRDEQVTTPIHTDAYYYPAPADMRGFGVIDLYKQGDFSDNNEQFIQRNILDTRVNKDDLTFTTESINGSHYLRINKSLSDYRVLDRMGTLANFTASTNVSNLDADTVQFVEGGQSIKFDIDQVGSATTAIITSTITSVDLTSYENNGSIFEWIYLPTASGITSITKRWGNSAGTYWSKTVTTTHAGTAFQNGWNQLRFDWSSATETGTVDVTAIDYSEIRILYDGTTQLGLRLDFSTISLGRLYRVKYYSKYMFRNATTGVWTDSISSDSDIVNLDTDSYNLLLYKASSLFHQHQHDYNYKPTDSEADRFELEYQKKLIAYKRKYKSELVRRQVQYY